MANVTPVDKDGNLLGGTAGTVPTDATVAPTNTSGQVIAANAGRISALIRNIGTVTVYLHQGATAATASHFPLNPGEGITIRHQLAVQGIAASGTGSLYIIEEAR